MVGVFGSLAILTLLLSYFAGALAGYIPFKAEQRLAAKFAPLQTDNPPLQAYLQGVADRLVQAERLPVDMPITVHYVDGDTVNAFATLGGHVVFFRGLLEKVPDENTLAMVMAHEIAHVKARAPLRALGRGMVIAAALQLINTELGTELSGSVLGQTGLLTQLKFSREQESEADAVGQAALVETYGGVVGVDALFHLLDEVSAGEQVHVAEWYRSHPEIRQRIADLDAQAVEHGWPQGEAMPLPPQFQDWLKTKAVEGDPDGT